MSLPLDDAIAARERERGPHAARVSGLPEGQALRAPPCLGYWLRADEHVIGRDLDQGVCAGGSVYECAV